MVYVATAKKDDMLELATICPVHGLGFTGFRRLVL